MQLQEPAAAFHRGRGRLLRSIALPAPDSGGGAPAAAAAVGGRFCATVDGSRPCSGLGRGCTGIEHAGARLRRAFGFGNVQGVTAAGVGGAGSPGRRPATAPGHGCRAGAALRNGSRNRLRPLGELHNQGATQCPNQYEQSNLKWFHLVGVSLLSRTNRLALPFPV